MEIMERDPKYIAETVKLIRTMFKFTQENLADAANLSTRTIQKVESGRHKPDEQTLRSMARALNMDARVFEKPTPEQKRRCRAEIERGIRKKIMVHITPVRDERDFLSWFDQHDAYHFDTSAVEGDAAMDLAASIADWIQDLNDVWEVVYQSEKLEYARSFSQLCEEIEGYGYVCHMGNYRQRMSGTIFDVGLIAILRKDDTRDQRAALVTLEGGWEVLEEDRMELPDLAFKA